MISTTLITFNRLDYTKQTIESYTANTVVKHELIVVDNASTDGTREYLQKLHQRGVIQKLILNETNLFPGQATNQGFSQAAKQAKFLHRSDNDLIYHKDWDKDALSAFNDLILLGQLGLVCELQQAPLEQHAKFLDLALITKSGNTLLPTLNPNGTIGGPCIIRAEVFKYVQYPHDLWVSGVNEDAQFSQSVQRNGFKAYQMVWDKVAHIGFGDMLTHYDYYEPLYRRRNIPEVFDLLLSLEKKGLIKDHQLQKLPS